MNLYEHTIVARQDTSPAQIKQLTEKYSKIVEKNDGEIVQTEEWGLLNLAYDIKKNKKGTYIHFKIKGLGKIIEDHFKDGTKYGVNISYHREKKPLGTAGSLRSINVDKNNPIIVTNGDVITEVNYSEILDYHKTHHADATMAVRTVDQENPYGVVEAEGVKFKNIIEKPITKISVNAGIYVLNNKAIQLTPKNSKYDMTDLFSKLRKKNKNTVIFPIHENLKEYGSRNDINKKKK